jgi:hypothetical protein
MSQKKVIALLELTGNFTQGNKYVESFNYYWTLYPNFITFEIVDNKDNIPYLIELLDKYYQEGYRIFFGPVTSKNTQGIISWFSNPIHSDAICLTPIAASSSLILPENMYKLQPSNFYFLDYIQQVTSATRVFYFYNPSQLVCSDFLTELQNRYGSSNIITYPVITGAELNATDVQTFFNNNSIAPINDIVIEFLINGNQRQIYFDLFKTVNIGNVQQFSVIPTNFPNVTNDVVNLYNNYSVIFLESLNSTSILNESITELGSFYAVSSLTSLYLLTLFANNESIDNAYYYGEVVPWFDDNNGIKYWSYNIFMYNSNGLSKTNIYLNDPSYGILTFNKKV